MSDYFAGIDIGSTMTKVVIMNDGIISSIIGPTGPEQRRLANNVMDSALRQIDLPFDVITYLVATGYGRINVPFADKQVTEISCHAKGVAHLFPRCRTIIDIGGQDSKGITIDDGRPTNFVMNDKCAAGTGRFLEVIADALGIALENLDKTALGSKQPASISSICTVFAKQEVVARLAEGVPLNDLVAGILESLASRISRMVKRLKVANEVVITGGGAKNAGLVKALSDKLGYATLVPPEPLITGAVGAALLGKDIVQKATKNGLPLERKRRLLEEIEIL
ncbi:MAG: 2-hydroxyglutaryl-CoA dehydratase [Deltaproteobacteria bacterium]|nr:2-hydroxyglutaryl-CoA dehydratase [Deltaproteobacteria bacterium]